MWFLTSLEFEIRVGLSSQLNPGSVYLLLVGYWAMEVIRSPIRPSAFNLNNNQGPKRVLHGLGRLDALIVKPLSALYK